MPTYDFECDNCGYKIERFVRIIYPKKSQCPQCKTNNLIRLIGIGSGFIFRGEGFYENYKQQKDAVKENNKMNEEKKERSIEDKEF